MQWFLLFTGVVAAFLLVVLVAGLFVPVAHRASVSERVEGAPEEVWKAMTDPEDFPEWRPGVYEVVMEASGPEGPERWVEKGPTGSLTLEVVEREAPVRLVLRIADGDLPFGGTWTYELEARNGGTAVTITEEGEIHNPLFRFVAHFLLGYDATMKDYLAGLERRMSGREGEPG